MKRQRILLTFKEEGISYRTFDDCPGVIAADWRRESSYCDSC